MDDQTLIAEPRFSFSIFFRKLIHRFKNGNAPFDNSIYQGHSDFSASWGLPYDSHPGPIAEALVDAKNLNRSLFVFIYCKENALTQRVITILSSQNVCEEMQRSFLFLPLDVTTPDGLTVANALQFHQLPLVALVRPHGDTLEESQVFVKHEGKIGESILLSYIRIERHDEEHPATVVEQQDNEYDQALTREQERIRQQQLHEEEEQMQEEIQRVVKATIEEAFNNLPPPPTSGERATVKFQFPDNNNQTRAFPRDGPTSMLFTFARKYVFPKDFVLKVGFPPTQIDETEEPLSVTCRDKQFICYVEPE